MVASAAIQIASLLLIIMLVVACSPAQNTEQPPAGARNVILFVGDGFGASQTSLGVLYERLIEERELNIESLMRDGNTGYALPRPKDFGPYYVDPDDSASALLGRALSRHTYVVWSTGEHTTDPVPTYGRGPGAEKLRGIYPNTHIHSVMREALEARHR